MLQTDSITHDELIFRFESNADLDRPFHHADHVQLAFAYLEKYSVLLALEKFSAALRNFATAHGKTQLYHETITFAFFFLIRERMARMEFVGWDEFVHANPDLFIWKDGILTRYYQEATLKSDFARTVFVLPDKR